MNEPINSVPDFGMETGEDLDIAAIFGGGGTADVNPFAEIQPTAPSSQSAQIAAPQPLPPVETAAAQLVPVAESETATPTETTLPVPSVSVNPIAAALPGSAQLSLFDKPPIFSYGGAKENIEDASQTFEELRITKSEDFPELEEGKKVSWTVRYGKVTKPVLDPKETTIASVKEEIERSKAFLDGLKKEKNKNPDCLVEPRVTAQSKGIASYKGVFSSPEEARNSDKVICLLPARDGQVYELRRTELGEFIAPKNNVVELSAVRAGFTPALPLIPRALTEQIIAFFRRFMNERAEFEVLVHIYWDRKQCEFVANIPKQTVSKTRIDADLTDSPLPPERYLHYADIHSHNSMSADFSDVDDRDERSTRLYLVVGELDRLYPAISARISCGGTLLPIPVSQVLEGFCGDFPLEWLENVTAASPKPRVFRLSGELPEALEK